MPKRLIRDVLAGRVLVTTTPETTVRAASKLIDRKSVV